MKLSSEIEKQGRPVAKSAELIPKLFLAFSGQIAPHVMSYLSKQGTWKWNVLQLVSYNFRNIYSAMSPLYRSMQLLAVY